MELQHRIYNEENGLTYTLTGDYYLPDLQLPEEPGDIGKWGRMHRDYLQQHQPIRFSDLVLSGELHHYLATVNAQATARLECLIDQMKDEEGITEELKAQDQMAWVRAMNNIRNRAEEIVMVEFIYD